MDRMVYTCIISLANVWLTFVYHSTIILGTHHPSYHTVLKTFTTSSNIHFLNN